MHSYDHAELEAYLRAHVSGFDRLDAMEKFSGGQSNPTYRLRSGDESFVLRAKPPGKLLPSAHAVDREFRVMSALAGRIPVPEMLHLSGDETPLGTQFFVMSHVDGEIHWDPAMPDSDPRTRAAVYDAMNGLLADLHAIDPAAVGLEAFGKPGNYFERQLGRWVTQYRASETEPRPDVDWVIDWLTENMVADDGQVAIVHGDYRIDNIIFDENARPLALLDWELSTLGHPLADLAYQVMIWQLPNAGRFKGLAGLDRSASSLPTDESYLEAYCRRRATEVPANWNFYLAFTCFRFLAIIQGVLKRGLEGNASNPAGMAVMKGMVDLLAEQAKSFASR